MKHCSTCTCPPLPVCVESGTVEAMEWMRDEMNDRHYLRQEGWSDERIDGLFREQRLQSPLFREEVDL